MLTSVSPAANIAAREGLIKHGGDAWKRERAAISSARDFKTQEGEIPMRQLAHVYKC